MIGDAHAAARRRTGAKALAALAFASALAGCDVLEPPSERAAPPDVVLRRVTLEQYRRGAHEASATVRDLAYTRVTGRAELQKLQLVPMEAGRRDGLLDAASGTAELKRGQVRLEGGVRYLTATDDALDTAACTVDLANKTARGTDAVSVRGPGYELAAPGFTADFAGETLIELAGGVEAKMDAPPAPAPAPKANARRAKKRTSSAGARP